jgi:uncharacterized membrane protein
VQEDPTPSESALHIIEVLNVEEAWRKSVLYCTVITTYFYTLFTVFTLVLYSCMQQKFSLYISVSVEQPILFAEVVQGGSNMTGTDCV